MWKNLHRGANFYHNLITIVTEPIARNIISAKLMAPAATKSLRIQFKREKEEGGGSRRETFSSHGRQRAASSAAQKRTAGALSQTSQMVRMLPSFSFLSYHYCPLPHISSLPEPLLLETAGLFPREQQREKNELDDGEKRPRGLWRQGWWNGGGFWWPIL